MDVIDTRIGVEARQLEAKRRQKDIQEAQFRTNIENVGLKAPKAMSAKHRCVSMGHLTENGENGGMENIEHTKLGRVNSLDYGRKKTKLDRAMSIKAQFLRNSKYFGNLISILKICVRESNQIRSCARIFKML